MYKFYCWCFVLINITSCLIAEKVQVRVSVEKHNDVPIQNNVFTRRINVTSPDADLERIYIPEDDTLSFFVIEAHSFNKSVSLRAESPAQYDNGTNIGLVQMLTTSNSVYQFTVSFEGDLPHNLMLAVVTYKRDDPIPGGCNMEFPTEIAPYLNVSGDSDLIRIDAAPASIPNYICEKDVVALDFYQLFLSDDSEAEFFHRIERMLNVDAIKEYGYPLPRAHDHNKIFLSNNRFNLVYVIVARFGNRTSAYVPTAVYGCNYDAHPLLCAQGSSVGEAIVAFMMIAAGLAMILSPEFTLFTFNVTFTVSTILFICLGPLMSYIYYVLISGVVSGLILCLTYEAQRFKTVFNNSIAGLSFASFLMSSVLLANLTIMYDNAIFWATFFIIAGLVFIFAFFLEALQVIPGIILLMSGLDYFFGTTLFQFTTMNFYRRLYVKNFNNAVMNLPVSIIDMILLISVCAFVITAKVYCGRVANRRGYLRV